MEGCVFVLWHRYRGERGDKDQADEGDDCCQDGEFSGPREVSPLHWHEALRYVPVLLRLSLRLGLLLHPPLFTPGDVRPGQFPYVLSIIQRLARLESVLRPCLEAFTVWGLNPHRELSAMQATHRTVELLVPHTVAGGLLRSNPAPLLPLFGSNLVLLLPLELRIAMGNVPFNGLTEEDQA